MAYCYVKAYFDWIEQTAALSDAERGRLFIAILEYGRSGLEPKLDGRESILFPVFRAAIDRDNKQSKTNAENGAKGGRGRKATESEKKRNKATESEAKPTKEKEEEKDKDKEKENNIPPNPQGGDCIPYAEIIDFLNEKAGTSYRASGEKTKSCIRARWNDGFRLDDFKAVIAGKSGQWKGTDMAKYLRPETLFGTKFEGYLNEGGTSNGTNSSAAGQTQRIGHYI